MTVRDKLLGMLPKGRHAVIGVPVFWMLLFFLLLFFPLQRLLY